MTFVMRIRWRAIAGARAKAMLIDLLVTGEDIDDDSQRGLKVENKEPV